MLKIRAHDDLQPIVRARHRGEANFIVVTETRPGKILFNEIGNYVGEILVSDMPAGSYLLSVQADGQWTIRFSP